MPDGNSIAELQPTQDKIDSREINKPWKTPIKGVIFDMDGLIVETEDLHKKSLIAVFQHYGVKIPDDFDKLYDGFVGKPDSEQAKLIVEKYSSDGSPISDPVDNHIITPEEWLSIKYQEHAKLIQNPDEIRNLQRIGLYELLDELQKNGVQLAIASGSSRKEIEIVIKALGLEKYFGEHYYSAEDSQFGGIGKPDPSMFNFIANKVFEFTDKASCLVIGDASSDMNGAKNSGMRCYISPSIYTRGFKFGFLDADRQLLSLRNVLPSLYIDSPDTFNTAK